MENSRRDLLNDVAERKPTLKNYESGCPTRFWFRTRNRYSILQNGGFILSVNVVLTSSDLKFEDQHYLLLYGCASIL